MGKEEAPSEQSVFVELVSEFGARGSCAPIQKAHPCETDDLLLKGILTPGRTTGVVPCTEPGHT